MLKWFNVKANSVWAGVLLSCRMLVSITIQKIVAVNFGPSGTALFSHFQNILSIFTQPLQDIIGQGLISAYPKENFNNKSQLVGNALIFSLYIILSIGVLVAISHKATLAYFQFDIGQLCLLFIALILLSFQLLLANYLIAKQRLKMLALLFVTQWLLIITILYILKLSINELLLYYVLLQAGFTVLYFVIIAASFKEISKPLLRLDAKLVHHFRQFLLIGVTIWLSSKLTDYFIRDYALTNFGTIETGYWQSAARVSEAFKGLFISFLMMTVYPILAATEDQFKIQEFMKKQLTNMMLIIPAGTIILYWLSPFMLETLYSTSFSNAVELLRIHLIGDLIAFFSFPFALLLMAKVETKRYIVAEITSVVSYILIIFLLKNQGIEKIIYAYIVRSSIYLISTVSFSKKYFKFA